MFFGAGTGNTIKASNWPWSDDKLLFIVTPIAPLNEPMLINGNSSMKPANDCKNRISSERLLFEAKYYSQVAGSVNSFDWPISHQSKSNCHTSHMRRVKCKTNFSFRPNYALSNKIACHCWQRGDVFGKEEMLNARDFVNKVDLFTDSFHQKPGLAKAVETFRVNSTHFLTWFSRFNRRLTSDAKMTSENSLSSRISIPLKTRET